MLRRGTLSICQLTIAKCGLATSLRNAHSGRYIAVDVDDHGNSTPSFMSTSLEPDSRKLNTGGIDARTDSGRATYINGIRALEDYQGVNDLYPSRSRLEAFLVEEEARAADRLNVHLPLALHSSLDKYRSGPRFHTPRPSGTSEYRRLTDDKASVGYTQSKI